MKTLLLLNLFISALLLNSSSSQGKQLLCGKGSSLPNIQTALNNALPEILFLFNPVIINKGIFSLINR
jgi:hypothetical protein